MLRGHRLLLGIVNRFSRSVFKVPLEGFRGEAR